MKILQLLDSRMVTSHLLVLTYILVQMLDVHLSGKFYLKMLQMVVFMDKLLGWIVSMCMASTSITNLNPNSEEFYLRPVYNFIYEWFHLNNLFDMRMTAKVLNMLLD